MKKILFILLLLSSIYFWGFAFIPQRFHYLSDAIALLIMGIIAIRTFSVERMKFKYAIILFMIGIITNIFAAYINHGQNLRDTFIAFGSFYFIIFYFTLHYLQLNRKYLENIIIIFAVLYSIFYIIQYNLYPIELFGGGFRDRGTIRLRIPGSGFLMLAYFLSLNRYFINQKPINIFFLGFFFVILIIGGFRTLTLGAVLVTGLMFFKMVRYSPNIHLTIILAFIILLGISRSRTTSSIIKNMVLTTQSQQEEGSDYIRLQQYEFFFKEYPEDKSYYIFGGGFPAGDGYYNQKMQFFTNDYGFYWVDLGLIGFYIVIGAIALTGILWYTIKAITINLPLDSIYLKFYFIYLLLVSFTTMEIYRAGVFGVEAIVLYLIDISVKEDKSLKTHPKNNNYALSEFT